MCCFNLRLCFSTKMNKQNVWRFLLTIRLILLLIKAMDELILYQSYTSCTSVSAYSISRTGVLPWSQGSWRAGGKITGIRSWI